MDDQSTALLALRSAMRKDLSTIGVLPTALGIQQIAQLDQALGFALLCEAVYVQLYNACPLDHVLAYLAGPLQIHDPAMRQYILRTVLRVREALSAAAGDQEAALRQLLGDAGAEQAVLVPLIEACARTAGEFAIPWSTVYFPTYRPRTRHINASGVAIIALVAVAALYGLYQLICLLTG